MSKKSSIFALEMKKKSYIQPITETVLLGTLDPLALADPTRGEPGNSTQASVKAPVF